MKENCDVKQMVKEYVKGCVVGAPIGFFAEGGTKGAIKGCVIGGTTKASDYQIDCNEKLNNGIPCNIL